MFLIKKVGKDEDIKVANDLVGCPLEAIQLQFEKINELRQDILGPRCWILGHNEFN